MLEVSARKKEENAKDLIKGGFVPAVIYGPHLKANKLVKIKINSLDKALAAAGEATLIDLTIDGKTEGKVLIKDYQRDAVKDNLIHVDLYEVDMAKEIYANVPLKFVGVSAAVADKGGVLVESIDEVEVKCLPGDLVSHIDVDLSVLANIHDVIKIHDLKLPKGVKLTTETDDVVATVTEIEVEEEPTVAPAEAEAAAIAAATPADESKKEEGKK
jgi:large subunit ribosomal protein L25